MELTYIISQFLQNPKIKTISPIGNGLIHSTFLVEEEQQSYILQNVNQSIFEYPELLVSNHLKINQKLNNTAYQLQVYSPIKTIDNQLIFKENDSYWRLTNYIEDSIVYEKAESPAMAYDASKALSHFHFCINSGEKLELDVTLPSFTDFGKRVSDFKASESQSDIKRSIQCVPELNFLKKYVPLAKLWTELTEQEGMPKRVIHADPKISNILFDSHKNPIAIIDLDTVLSGYILYDFGDMTRSFCNKLAEDGVSITDNFDPKTYEAIKEGFLFHTEKMLTPLELEHLDYSAKMVVYIQAMRFLVDFIQGDRYYDVDYDLQNLHRAQNQINLLKGLMKFLD